MSNARWPGQMLEYREDGIVRLSIPFTWNLPEAYQRAVWLRSMGHRVLAGGPAVALMPDYLADVAEVGTSWPGALQRHNPLATRTSEGCPNRCSFCAVWRTEGGLKELDDWPFGNILCDNNLTACSRRHWDRVIDQQKRATWTDFNQGLDARKLTKYHAERIAELKRPLVRLAFDHVDVENDFHRAYEILRAAGFPKRAIRVYVLVGYKDTPEDALYRLQTVAGLGIDPNPMRYNPLNTLVRDSHVGEHWTDRELTRYVRYWANLRWFRAVPFAEFR